MSFVAAGSTPLTDTFGPPCLFRKGQGHENKAAKHDNRKHRERSRQIFSGFPWKALYPVSRGPFSVFAAQRRLPPVNSWLPELLVLHATPHLLSPYSLGNPFFGKQSNQHV